MATEYPDDIDIDRPFNAYQSACEVVIKKYNLSQGRSDELYADIVGPNSIMQKLMDMWNDPLLKITIPSDHFVVGNITDPDIGDFLPTPITIPDDLEIHLPPPPPDPGYTGIVLTDLTIPSVGTLIEPVISMNPGDLSYASSLLTLIQQKLEHDIEFGGTGLNESVETAIFQRELERSQQVHSDTMDRLSSQWAKAGFDLPNGVLANLYQEEELNYTNKRLDASRDISIKQAELAQTNTHFAIEQGISIETQLMNIANLFSQRLLDASRETSKAQIELYVAQMQRYKIEVDIYSALVLSRIEQAKGLIAIYTSQVLAYKSQVEAEAARVKALTEVVNAEVERYKADAEVYRTVSDVELRKFEARIRKGIAEAELSEKEWALKLRKWEIEHQISFEGMRAQAEVLAHLIAGMLSAVSAAASISGSGSTSTTTSIAG